MKLSDDYENGCTYYYDKVGKDIALMDGKLNANMDSDLEFRESETNGFRLKVLDDNTLEGYWYNSSKGKNYPCKLTKQTNN